MVALFFVVLSITGLVLLAISVEKVLSTYTYDSEYRIAYQQQVDNLGRDETVFDWNLSDVASRFRRSS